MLAQLLGAVLRKARLGDAYTQDGQEDVDAEVTAAPALEEDTKRGKEDGEDDLADIAVEVCQFRVAARSGKRMAGEISYLAVKAMVTEWGGYRVNLVGIVGESRVVVVCGLRFWDS